MTLTARWNVSLYENKEGVGLNYRPDESLCNLVFYHFQGITYFSRKIISTNINKGIENVDYKWIGELYEEYVKKLDIKKVLLKKNYNLETLILSHPAHKNDNKSLLKSTALWKKMVLLYTYMTCKSLVIHL